MSVEAQSTDGGAHNVQLYTETVSGKHTGTQSFTAHLTLVFRRVRHRNKTSGRPGWRPRTLAELTYCNEHLPRNGTGESPTICRSRRTSRRWQVIPCDDAGEPSRARICMTKLSHCCILRRDLALRGRLARTSTALSSRTSATCRTPRTR